MGSILYVDPCGNFKFQEQAEKSCCSGCSEVGSLASVPSAHKWKVSVGYIQKEPLCTTHRGDLFWTSGWADVWHSESGGSFESETDLFC